MLPVIHSIKILVALAKVGLSMLAESARAQSRRRTLVNIYPLGIVFLHTLQINFTRERSLSLLCGETGKATSWSSEGNRYSVCILLNQLRSPVSSCSANLKQHKL